MKASELRIGNWVHEENRFCISEFGADIFQWDKCDWYNEGNGNQNLNKVDPITLTEKWLLRFGFQKVKEYANYDFLHYEYGRFWVYLIGDKYEIELVTGDERFNFTTQFQYVHSLQNLYFSIIGDELLVSGDLLACQ